MKSNANVTPRSLRECFGRMSGTVADDVYTNVIDYSGEVKIESEFERYYKIIDEINNKNITKEEKLKDAKNQLPELYKSPSGNEFELYQSFTGRIGYRKKE